MAATVFRTVLNNMPWSTLGSAYVAASGSLVLATGDGAKLTTALAAESQVTLSSTHWLEVTVATDNAHFTAFKATALSGDTLTVAVIDGSTDRNYALGTSVYGGWTSGAVRAHETAINTLETTVLYAANNLSDIGTAATARTNLGLGSAATHAATDFDAAGAAAAAQAASAPAAGSSSIVTVGTITTGTWQGSVIAAAYIGAIPESGVTNLVSDLALKAPLASPALTGTPTAPTAAPATNTTQIATTAFVIANASAAPVDLVSYSLYGGF